MRPCWYSRSNRDGFTVRRSFFSFFGREEDGEWIFKFKIIITYSSVAGDFNRNFVHFVNVSPRWSYYFPGWEPKSKGTTANIRGARISYTRITDFSCKSRYGIFARKLVGQLSTLPIIIADRSKIHEFSMRSDPRSREISLQLSDKLPRSAYPRYLFFFLFFFFFSSPIFLWRFNHPRDEIIPAWIEYVLISMSINISNNPHDLHTKLFESRYFFIFDSKDSREI